MEKLNALEQSAKWNADNWEPVTVASTKDILAIAEAFRALERGQCGGALLEREEHHVSVVTELLKRISELEQRAEAAEAKLAGMLPDVEKWRPVDQVRAQMAYRAAILRNIQEAK